MTSVSPGWSGRDPAPESSGRDTHPFAAVLMRKVPYAWATNGDG